MSSLKEQTQFTNLAKSKFNPKELDWVLSKTAIVSNVETSKKFNMFFSLTPRFVSNEIITWSPEEIKTLKNIYPGFSLTQWNKQDLTRILLMLALAPSVNKSIIEAFFEIAEMKEQVVLYKGLYLLENASEFSNQVAEGIRTNMVNVFDAIASGNPFAQKYLDDEAWNQLILKSFFMDRPLYTIQNIDQGKNEDLANMLQDYVKERWAAGRQVSIEIWRMIVGYLRDDLKQLISERSFEGLEKEVIDTITQQNSPSLNSEYWERIGKTE
ncbi:EboA domain-containing protein [Snuella sedimenti]|uniref:EboA domain-containing protein n=1 Tax=Snuella sedimenti TaxID=2798802 RepID=A0A8J7IU52_9FLAO|nr:EboA domain-containing protein [Snuella sedimenti]MBJ6366655.1 EboA domain-containing protein [Snuella sedimenti]